MNVFDKKWLKKQVEIVEKASSQDKFEKRIVVRLIVQLTERYAEIEHQGSIIKDLEEQLYEVNKPMFEEVEEEYQEDNKWYPKKKKTGTMSDYYVGD